MAQRVPFEQVESVISEHSYPMIRSDAAVEFAETIIVENGKEYNLGEVISDADSDTYPSPEVLLEDIEAEIMTATEEQ